MKRVLPPRLFTPSYSVEDIEAALLTFLTRKTGLPQSEVRPQRKLSALGLTRQDLRLLKLPKDFPQDATVRDLVVHLYLMRVEEGQKRNKHLMLRGGRGSFKPKAEDEVPLPTLPSKKKQRQWADFLAPLAARTQSPASHARAQARKQQKEAKPAELEEAILQGLIVYGGETALRFPEGGRALPDSLYIPHDPTPLIEAGVPAQAAKLLSRQLGGREVIQQPPAEPEDWLDLVLGGFPVVQSDVPKRGHYVDLSEPGSLNKLLGPARKARSFLSRARKARRDQLVPVQVSIDGRIIPPRLDVRDALLRRQDRGFRQLTLVFPGGPTVVLPYSFLTSLSLRLRSPDYHSLRGFSLDELPAVAARRLTSPRRSNMPRKKKARKNPTKKLTRAQILAGFGGKAAMNRAKKNTSKKRRAKSNTSKKVVVGLFPAKCVICGRSTKGMKIHQVGRGPRGGKQMAHVNCG